MFHVVPEQECTYDVPEYFINFSIYYVHSLILLGMAGHYSELLHDGSDPKARNTTKLHKFQLDMFFKNLKNPTLYMLALYRVHPFNIL